MMKKNGWWESRLGAGSAVRATLDEGIPGGAKFTYALGSAALLTFILLAVTGIFELFYYVPSATQAYDSVNFLRFQVPFGWLVHGIHFWAANLMVVIVALHLLQTFVWGAFKKPRELTWVLGVALFVFTLLAVFSGAPLAWDEKGYWAARVGSGLAGSIPVVGASMRDLLFGGATPGQLTLSRLFPIHIVLVPLLIAGVFLLHLVAFRKGGAAGPFTPSLKIGNFWPRQVLMDLLMYSGLVTAVIWVSARFLTPVTGPADPIDSTYIARPDWPFLWLFQFLKYLNGPLEWMGFAVVPLVAIVILVAIPWLDRSAERSPFKRPVWMFAMVVAIAFVGVLTWLGATQQPLATQAVVAAPAPTPAAAIEPTPTAPGPSLASHTIGSAEHGKDLFAVYCLQCHGPEGKKGIANPNSVDGEVPAINPMDAAFTGAEKGQPIVAQKFVDGIDVVIQNGSTPDATPTASEPKYKMPSFGNTYALTQPQIANIEAYVLEFNGVQRATIQNPGVEPKKYAWWTLVGFAVVAIIGAAGLMSSKD